MEMQLADRLPDSWVWASVRELTLPVEQIDPRQSPDEEFAYLDISGIDNSANVVAESKSCTGSEAPSRARQLVRARDVLFSTVRTYLKNIAKVPSRYDGAIASTGFSILRCGNAIDPDYLFYYTLTPAFLNPLRDLQRGSSYPAVRDADVRDQQLPLPPLSEQHRIVAKVEELFSGLDAGAESLKTAREQLMVYRQALLKHAFEGKLTAAWRAENPDKLESADALLARIHAEREERCQRQHAEWEDAVLAWERSGGEGRKPSRPSKPKELPPLTADELTELPELPRGWMWSRLGEVFAGSPKNGLYKPASDYGAGVPIVRIDDFYDGSLIKRSGFKRVRLTEEEAEVFTVAEGDLLVNRVNSIEYLGKCCVVNGLSDATVFESNIMKLTLLADVVSSNYAVLYLSSHSGRLRLCSNAKHAVNQASINQTDVAMTPMPVACMAEQCALTEVLSSQLSSVVQLAEEIRVNLHRSEALRQSILKNAFSGELVPQDPSDEPASVLLERIRAEKAGAEDGNHARKPRRSRKQAATR